MKSFSEKCNSGKRQGNLSGPSFGLTQTRFFLLLLSNVMPCSPFLMNSKTYVIGHWVRNPCSHSRVI
jgi:hypothetical protein